MGLLQIIRIWRQSFEKYDPTKSFVFSKGLWIPLELTTLEKEDGLYGDLFQIVK